MIHMRMEGPLLRRIDDFRFNNRFPTRAAAIKWLLDWALKQNPTPDRSSFAMLETGKLKRKQRGSSATGPKGASKGKAAKRRGNKIRGAPGGKAGGGGGGGD